MLTSCDCVPKLGTYIKKDMDFIPKIELHQVEDGVIEQLSQQIKEESEKAVASREAAPKPKKKTSSFGFDTSGYPFHEEEIEIVMGKIIKSAPIPIADTSIMAGRVAIYGEIISKDFKDTRDNRRRIYSIDITDKSSSVTVKLLIEKDKMEAIEALKKGNCLIVFGEIQEDHYDKSLNFKPIDISKTKISKRMERSELKRVELHAHTNDSAH